MRKILERLAPLGVALAAMAAVLFAAPAAHAAAAPGEALPGAAAPGDVSAYDVIQTFQNQASGMCLMIWPPLGTGTCDPASYGGQMGWWVHVWNDGTREIRNSRFSNTCLADYGGNNLDIGRLGTCDSSREQSWWITFWADGTIRFQNQATGRCLESGYPGMLNPTCNQSREQSWY